MRVFQKGFNFRQDGPGNRLVLHLQGCNLHCPWCSNPEGMSCAGGEEYSRQDIVRECVRSRAMMFSGGGVTFTGGEATMQAEELLAVLAMLREEGISTALETNGTSPCLPAIAEQVDYLIMDFKHYDGARLASVTGAQIESIRRNFEELSQNREQLHVRIPLINGFNADEPRGFAEYFSHLDTSHCVFEFLAYHEYGKEKWKTEYRVKDGFVSVAQRAAFSETFQKYGLKTITT